MIPDTQVEMQMHFSERQHVGGVARVSVKTEALDPRRASQPMSSSWPRPDLSRQYEDSKTQISTLLFGLFHHNDLVFGSIHPGTLMDMMIWNSDGYDDIVGPNPNTRKNRVAWHLVLEEEGHHS